MTTMTRILPILLFWITMTTVHAQPILRNWATTNVFPFTLVSTNGSVVGWGSNVVWDTGVTGYVSGSVLHLGSSAAPSSGTNALVSTNGITLGSGGTFAFEAGVTGYLAGSVLHLGVSSAGVGGGGLTTNANQFAGVPLSIMSGAQVTNMVFLGNVDVSAQAAVQVALITDGNGFLIGSGVTTNELGRLTGVTGGVQTNLDARMPTNSVKTLAAGQLQATNIIGTNLFVSGPTTNALLMLGGNSQVVTSSVAGGLTFSNGNLAISDSFTNYILGLVASVDQHFYLDTNVSTFNTSNLFVNTPAFTNTTMLAQPGGPQGTNTIAVGANGTYLLTRVSTQSVTRIEAGPVSVETWIRVTGGALVQTVTMHPELYFVTTNLDAVEVATVADTVFTEGSVFEKFNISMNVTNTTNFVMNGTKLALRWKVTSSANSPTVEFAVGGVYGSHVSMNVGSTAASSSGVTDWTTTASTTNVVGVSNYVVSVSNRLDLFTTALTNHGSAILQSATNYAANTANTVSNYALAISNRFNLFSVAASNLSYAIGTADTNYANSVTNSASVTNWINSRQVSHAVLSNVTGLASTVFTNVPAPGTNMGMRTVGGTNFMDMFNQPTFGGLGFDLNTIAGAGNGSTNYLLSANKGDMYLGSSNVNIYAVNNTSTTNSYYWNCTITNLSANTWGISFSSGTNRWRFASTGGTNAPSVLTNNTMLFLSGKSTGTNTLVGYTYFVPGL